MRAPPQAAYAYAVFFRGLGFCAGANSAMRATPAEGAKMVVRPSSQRTRKR